MVLEKNLDKILVIADSQTCIGYRLAGVKETHALDGKQAEKKLEELLEQENIGIIVVNEKTITQMDWRLKKKIDRIAKPVVIAVPGKEGPSEEAESLKKMISKALGFELKM